MERTIRERQIDRETEIEREREEEIRKEIKIIKRRNKRFREIEMKERWKKYKKRDTHVFRTAGQPTSTGKSPLRTTSIRLPSPPIRYADKWYFLNIKITQ